MMVIHLEIIILKVARLDFSIVTPSNFKYTSQRAKTEYRRSISTLVLGIDKVLGTVYFIEIGVTIATQ